MIIVINAGSVQVFVNEEAPRFYDARLCEFIRLTNKDYQKLTGHKLNLKEKLQFHLLKRSMKKAMKKDKEMTVRQFFGEKQKDPTLLGGIALAIGAIILLVYVLFLVFYKD